MMESNKHFNKNEAQLDNIETHMSNIGATMKSIEVQVGQLASVIGSQQKGQFLSDTIINPKEQCKVIFVRSSKELEGGVPKEKEILLEVQKKVEEEHVL